MSKILGGIEMSKNREITLIGIEIKKSLIDKHMTQTELAKRVGVSKNYISDIIHGRYQFIRSRALKKILDELEIKPIIKN